MDGKYQNNKSIIQSLQQWLIEISATPDSWEGNNLHIDEISNLEDIKRKEWLTTSLAIFDILLNQNYNGPLIFFLHFDLIDNERKDFVDHISLQWINDNMGEYTPPSFNATNRNYFNSFYKFELAKIKFDYDLVIKYNFLKDINAYYRTRYDKSEDSYSRELYFFKLD